MTETSTTYGVEPTNLESFVHAFVKAAQNPVPR